MLIVEIGMSLMLDYRVLVCIKTWLYICIPINFKMQNLRFENYH
ncbi:hypothetical protein XBJ2_1940006 [Xenorhabdus bovienii str. Jollieti]|uniref:Uncharacterized protein n=1 Tax=Xenorhabdus bovienii (strain SS-2004) TaxID=406818 RepID=D3V5T8_XENBS|nr:hypothetical protein XBJ1_3899 [Xenorhabdus bovienii SS-2004]CDH28766.1 hypothetical protein XBJ2_1940006 [Xenorhabdus bovienii str. Jollieti]